MKKVKSLLFIIIALLIIPFCVFAEDENTSEEANNNADEKTTPANVYFFRGQGCSHCAEAEEWFESIKEEYGSLFKIVDYETWYNEENADLMKKVADARGEEANGVPYIIVGNKSWNGFADKYKEEILNEIKSVSSTEVSKRYDIMKNMKSKKSSKKEESSSDVIALLVILLVAGGIGFGLYKARATT